MRGILVIYSEIAAADILRAYNWYETKQKGVGEKFLSSLGKAEASIKKTPLGFASKLN